MTEAGPGVELEVDGFPKAETIRGRDGNRLLLTGRQVSRGGEPLDTVHVHLAGLRIPSNGRWIALGLSVFAMVLGVAHAARTRRTPQDSPADPGDLQRARSLLMQELITLETLHDEGLVGPRTYERTHSMLMDALARVELSHARFGNAT
jgi:hypothetical protein